LHIDRAASVVPGSGAGARGTVPVVPAMPVRLKNLLPAKK